MRRPGTEDNTLYGVWQKSRQSCACPQGTDESQEGAEREQHVVVAPERSVAFRTDRLRYVCRKKRVPTARLGQRSPAKTWGHDLSEFYEGGLEKGGFSKLNLRKVRRRPGEGGGWTNIEGLRRGLRGA